jgi:hypothetical protein
MWGWGSNTPFPFLEFSLHPVYHVIAVAGNSPKPPLHLHVDSDFAVTGLIIAFMSPVFLRQKRNVTPF